MPTNPASEAVNLNTLKELAWKLRGEKWEYRYSPNCTEPHSVQGKSASICHTPWNTGNEETIMRFIAEAKNFLTHETISRLESLEAAVAKVEAERDELRETMAESCCSKLEANQRIANAQAEAASVFVPELRELQAELDARGQILDNIQTATGSTWWNGAIDWADRIFAAIQKADSIPGYQSKVTRELVPAYIGQLAKDRDHADRMYQAAADIATNHEKTISTITADLAAKDDEIAELMHEHKDQIGTIYRDKDIIITIDTKESIKVKSPSDEEADE